MTENKRYYIGNGENCTICDSNEGGSDFYNMLTQFEAVDRLNEQEEEIQRLKIQLQTDDVCNKCKHEYLVQQNDGYYISKCKKGFDECSKGTIKYCEDFELGDDVE